MSGATTVVVEERCSNAFVNRVLDLKLKCDKEGRKPTRYELAQVHKVLPNNLTEEIEQMFNRHSKGLGYV